MNRQQIMAQEFKKYIFKKYEYITALVAVIQLWSWWYSCGRGDTAVVAVIQWLVHSLAKQKIAGSIIYRCGVFFRADRQKCIQEMDTWGFPGNTEAARIGTVFPLNPLPSLPQPPPRHNQGV